MTEVDEALRDACRNANVLVMNGMANGIVGAMARSAAKGRTPGWQQVKAFQELQNMQQTLLLGDPTQYMNGLLSNQLPAAPVAPAPAVDIKALIAQAIRETIKPEALL